MLRTLKAGEEFPRALTSITWLPPWYSDDVVLFFCVEVVFSSITRYSDHSFVL